MASPGEDIMMEAMEQIEAERATRTQRYKTAAWYKARKAIRNAPLKLVKTGLGQIPFVGGVVSMGADTAINIALQKRRASKLAAAGQNVKDWPGVEEALRKAAKFEAKDIKQVAEKLDSNMVKLKDAANNADAAISRCTSSPDEGLMIDAAQALCQVDHYVTKLSAKVEHLKASLKNIEDYLAAVSKKNFEQQVELVKSINAAYDASHIGTNVAAAARPGPPLPPRNNPNLPNFRG